MKNAGYVEDRLVTPFVIYYSSDDTMYVLFPLVMETDYQACRYYNDERPLTLKEFNEMRKQ